MRIKIIAVLALLSMLLSSCDLSGLPFMPTPLPPPTTTPTPSPSPSPSPTPTPTPAPAQRVNQGDFALFIGDYELARSQYETAISQTADDDTRAAALVGLGHTLYLLGNCTDAVEYLQYEIDHFAESLHSAEAHYFLGQCRLAQGDPAAAAVEFARYIDYRPGLLDAYMHELRGDALVSAGDYAAAVDAYTSASQSTQTGQTDALQIKIGQAYTSLGDYNAAIRTLMALYETTQSDYYKAQSNFLAGQAYLALGLTEQAYARFQDSANNFPRVFDTYTGVVELVNAGQAVNDLNRGLVDYFAGQYGLAIVAFDRYLENNPDHDGTAHFYKAFSLQGEGMNPAAIDEWQALINDHAGDRFWTSAWDEIAYTHWALLGDPQTAAETLLEFVRGSSGALEAPAYLFQAGRYYERADMLNEAAATWERLIDEYPNDANSLPALFLSAICRYRLGDFPRALAAFQRMQSLSALPADQSQAFFWIGKTQAALGDTEKARSNWQQAAQLDPGGYYSERSADLLAGSLPFQPVEIYDLGFDLSDERAEAEEWLRAAFALPADANLSSPGALANDPRLQRSDAYWALGEYTRARSELAALQEETENDAANCFRLLDYFLERGFYRLAILTSRQILDLANLSDAETLNAPVYFNHIRFGPYYRDIVLPAARQNNLPPFLLFSLIRQESLFEGFIQSAAGARGLMQIMPETAQEEVNRLGWPSDYEADDLYRPIISLPLGAHYLARQVEYFDGDLYAALAAYNGGPGNAGAWLELANGDPDLFLEVIRPEETRRYLRQIYEFYQIYARLYERQP